MDENGNVFLTRGGQERQIGSWQAGDAEAAQGRRTDGVRAVPIQSRFADMFKEGALGTANVGNLDHRAGMAGIFKITKAPLRPADLPFMTDFQAAREAVLIKRLIRRAPESDMLQASLDLAVSGERDGKAETLVLPEWAYADWDNAELKWEGVA